MKSLLALILGLVVTSNVYALRCGNHLVNEGDMIVNAISYCGEPTARFQNSYYWKDLNGVGMSYNIHFDNFGAITTIDENRGD